MSINKDLYFTTATKIRKKIKEKDISPVEVVDYFIERIEKVNPKVNAFCTYSFDQARKQAKKAEDSIMKQENVGKLHGIPIGIKDLTPTKGIRTTFGSRALSDYVPKDDVLITKRIKDSGAIIMGKTNTPEFGYKGTTDNLLFGATKNPWNLEMTSGGSSGGSAAAVAAGLIPFAHGDDGGGSIRIPSSACGIFGLKPTYGRVPYVMTPKNMYGSQHPFLHSGPMARTVEDAALLFSAMAGYDSSDPYSLPDSGENFEEELEKDVEGIKIAYSPNLDCYEIDHRVQKTMKETLPRLERLGCTVEQVDLGLENYKENFLDTFKILWAVKQASNNGHLLEDSRHLLADDIVQAIERGRKISAVEYKQTEYTRTAVYQKIQRVLNNYDLLITPTIGVPAFPYQLEGPSQINGKEVDPIHEWKLTRIFNLTGHPVASVPIGFTEDSLPIGMQVVGNRFADSLILRLAHHYQKDFSWEHKIPQL